MHSVECPAEKRNSFRAIMKDIVQASGQADGTISMSFLTQQKRYEKRRIYDLLNVLSAIGVCRKIGTNNYVWIGLDNIRECVKNMGRELELRALDNGGLSVIELPESAHLGQVVKHFIWAYQFFGQNKVNIHRIANVMASDSVAPKKVLRRLYLVTHVLEHVKVVKHTETIGEYEMLIDVHELMLEVFRDLSTGSEIPPESILSSMNRIDSTYVERLHSERIRSCPLHKSPVYQVFKPAEFANACVVKSGGITV